MLFRHPTWIKCGIVNDKWKVDVASDSGVSVMALRIADFRLGGRFVPVNEPALICSEGEIQEKYHYWRGASGQRYLHSVFSLVECPPIPKANYILVERHEDGSRTALCIGQTVDEADSLNLAHLRQRSAQIGANEIHIHVLAESLGERTAVEIDLRARLITGFSAEKANEFCASQLC